MTAPTDQYAQDLPDPGRNLLRLIVLLVLGLVAWAALAELETITIVPGRVIPSGSLQTVAAPLGGRVVRLHAEAGMEVREGELLVELDSATQGAELSALKVDTMALEARRNRLQAGGSDASAGTETTGATAAAEAAAGRARAAARRAETEAARARAAEAAARVGEANAYLEGRTADLGAARAERDVTQELVTLRIEPEIALVRANARVRSLESDVASALSGRERARQNARAAVADMASLSAKLDGDAAVELADVTAAAERRQVGLTEAENRLELQYIRAPVAGFVQRVLPAGPGAFVQPGGNVVELVPAGKPLRVEVQIPAERIGFVQLGQEARVRFTAYNYTIHGSHEGKLVVLSPDSQTDPLTGRSFYLAEIKLEDAVMKSKRGVDLPISTGMTTEVVLVGEPRRVISYLTSPLTGFLQNAFRDP